MAKFRVFANSKQRFYIDIEAKTAYEAYDKAVKADGGDFTPENDGDWHVEGDIHRVEA